MTKKEKRDPAASGGETEVQRAAFADALVRRRTPRVHWNDGEGERSILVTKRMVIGSSPSVDIYTPDPLVSRVHAEIEVRDDGVWIFDVGSRNGTSIGDVRIGSARLPDKTRVRVGMTDLVVSYEGGDTQPVPMWEGDRFGPLVGGSTAMRELYSMLDVVARTDSPVLVLGETGTGKELVARAIHERSPREGGPFVIVDCAALPDALLDAELFGHTKGAFTGALAARVGAFESANGGTIFLDEVGELTLAMQPKLLRVLEARTVRRLGETTHRPVDARIVAATHRDLSAMVARGEFREDLFFRLTVVPVRVPSLRERREDIPTLTKHFVGEPEASSLDPAMLAELTSRPFRGNVRELRNLVQRARALGMLRSITSVAESTAAFASAPTHDDDPGAAPPPSRPEAASDGALFDADYRSFKESWLERGEREYLRRLLARHGGNVSAAARAAGIDRTHLHRLIRRAAL